MNAAANRAVKADAAAALERSDGRRRKRVPIPLSRAGLHVLEAAHVAMLA